MTPFLSKKFLKARSVQGFVVWGGLITALWAAMLPDEPILSQNEIHISYAIIFIALTGTVNIIARKTAFSFTFLDAIIFTWYIYFLARSKYKTVYPCDTYSIRVTIAIVLYSVLRITFASTIIGEKEIATAILLFVLCEAAMGISQIIIGRSRHPLYLATGSFHNPAPFAAVISSGLVMIAVWKKRITRLKSLKKDHEPRFDKSCVNLSRLSYFVMVVLLLLVLSTESRAALLATVISLGGIYRKSLRRFWRPATCLFLVVLIPLYYIKPGSVGGRIIDYRVSCLNIGNNPVFGNGIGGYFHQYAERMSLFSQSHPDFDFKNADVLDYAFCDILKIGVEQGLIGLCIVAVALVRLYFILNRRGRSLWAGFMNILIISLFSYPFELLTFQIIGAIIFAFAATAKKTKFSKKRKSINSSLRLSFHVGFMLLLTSCSISTANHVKQKVQAEYDFQKMRCSVNESTIKDYYRLLPWLDDNQVFVFDFGDLLSKRGRYIDSNEILAKGTLLCNDPMFYVLIGNNYMNMRSYDKAEKAYEKAFHVMPNRLYPLYRLMMLYELTGDNEKKEIMAKRIINFPVKIESRVTEAMKDSARFYLNAQLDEHGTSSQAKTRDYYR